MELLSEITTKLSIAASHKAWSYNSDQGTEGLKKGQIYIRKIWGQAHSLMELYPGIPEPYSQRRKEANLRGEVCRTVSGCELHGRSCRCYFLHTLVNH